MVVIVLAMGMGMRVMVAMRVVVMGMIMVMAAICVRMAVAVAGIGSANGVKLRHDLLDIRAEAFEHRLDDVVAQDQNPVGFDRGGKVAIADVPGEFRDMERVAAAHHIERLVGGRYLDDAASFQQQFIAGRQHDRLREVNQDLAAVGQLDRASAQVAFVMLKNRAAKHWLVARADLRCSPYGYRFQHAALHFWQNLFVRSAVSPANMRVKLSQ